MFTCAWTTKESRMSGVGPAVIQVWVLCQFGSMAGPLMLCLYTQSRFWLLVWQLLFNPIPLARAPNASLVYLPPAPLLAQARSRSTKNDVEKELPLSFSLESCYPILT